jgi:SAM-dependent methyltransferase
MFLYLHRGPILDAVKAAAPHLPGRLLDVGCGRKPYARLLSCREHIGVDVESSPHPRAEMDRIYDGQKLPFANDDFDSILCTEVVEHARDPKQLFHEMARVLKPGGHALITVPMLFHHHEEPYDFQRLTRYGMENLAREAGLHVVWIKPRGGVYASFLGTLYTAVGQTLSRRPFIDLVLWILWPFALALLKFERWRNRPVVLSLGWQMLAVKPRREEGA